MSAVSISELSAESSSIAAISTNARIDYILRFSKQAVLVVGDNNYSNIGSLFLGNLPAEHNASYVAISVKLNDIQIRCRIIEQLFADVLFDPEQALAVSILRLAKGSKQPISIVIDHAHHLSFQLIHELTYLAQVAKKAKLTINVVMLGNYSAGSKISHEKSLFGNKIALVDAQSGQLLKLDNKLFMPKRSALLSKGQRKYFFVFASLLLLLIITLLLLSQSSTIGSMMNQKSEINSNQNPLGLAKDQFVNLADVDNLPSKLKIIRQEKVATQAEIYQALLQPKLEFNNTEIAKPIDVLKALEQVNEPTKSTFINGAKINLNTNSDQQKILVNLANKVDRFGINPNYYLEHDQGYVIQIAGVVNKTAFDNAVQRLGLAEYYGYYRFLNKNKLLVLTSKIYSTRGQANNALGQLSTIVRKQSPWIKPLLTVKKEIMSYQNKLN